MFELAPCSTGHLRMPRAPSAEGPADAFRRWLLHDFRRVLPFRCMAAVLGVMHSGGITPTHLLGANFPLGHLRHMKNRAGALESPLLTRWLQRPGQAMAFDPETDALGPEFPPGWVASFRQHRLGASVVHGRLDAYHCVASYFSFHGLPPGAVGSAPWVLERHIEDLHERLVNCVHELSHPGMLPMPAWELLTQQERVIAKAVGGGASNLAIATEMGLRENTVKTHMSHILGKLGLRSRAQLCAVISEWPIDGMRWVKVLN